MKDLPKLNDLFNITPIQDENKNLDITEVASKLNSNRELDQEDDYQLARDTLRNLIVKGSGTLDDISNLARNSEHPRTYEVTGQIIKTLSDVAKDLLNLQKQMKDIKEEDPATQIGTQNNIVFAGSTNDLMKLLNKKDDGNTIDQ